MPSHESLTPDPMTPHHAPLPREAILGLIPHQHGMCLLDEVLDYSATRIRCASRGHLAPDHPLRGRHGLRSVHLCEYGAQAMAVHGGLLARDAGSTARPGLLVSLRGVTLHRRLVTVTATLDVEADLLMDSPASWQYSFRVSADGVPLAEGRAAVMLLP
jgi:predicted hotdog family 3-hydroxylacyl-ACP dehydratase